ncbi:thioesterase [Dietzia sp. B19]|uniref:thioesterase II family protein n=1 Tax=Dietzia sp. B19 TaxID=1630632 RepID=UPI0015FB3A98|nr:alpha/beta fold hydrolase [Dietzia sp. B19]MBB1058591.1 thioesterase [Dietzia sp. B19]
MTDPNAQSRWLRCLAPRDDASTTVVCFPHAGGSTSYFHPLARCLDESVELYAVQYPGRQDRRLEPCLDSVPALAEGALPELLDLPDRPTVYFGHSLGASVGFEAARMIADRGRELTAFLPSGRPGPRAHKSLGLHTEDDAAMLAEMRRLSGTDSRLLDDPEFVQLILPTMRADYAAAEKYDYVPGEPLNCPIVALHGSSDDWISEFDAAEWGSETTAEFELRVFDGGHFYLADQWPEIAREIHRVAHPSPSATH